MKGTGVPSRCGRKVVSGRGRFGWPPSCSVGMDFLPDPFGIPVLGDVESIAALQVHPELRRRAEVASQPDCRVGGDRPLAVDDFVDAPRGDGEALRKTVLARKGRGGCRAPDSDQRSRSVAEGRGQEGPVHAAGDVAGPCIGVPLTPCVPYLIQREKTTFRA